LLNVLAGEMEPDRGSIRRAERLQIVRFDQSRELLDRSVTLRRALCADGDTVLYRGKPMHVVAWGKRFLFRPEQLEGEVGYLSGGEQARVLIAQLMLQPADVLILDEPTNDLDIGTIEVLEESLADFPGALVLVTHDRFLLDRISTEILALDGQGGAGYFADFYQWEQWREAEQRKSEPPAGRPAAKPAARSRALSPSEARDLSRMEEKIEAAEAEVARLELLTGDPAVASNYPRLMECVAELDAARAKVTALYARWEELEAKQNAG
jgi:ABC transport system ATP-binding/permease protein